MKRRLMDILACPIDKFYPLDLQVFEEKKEIATGIITRSKCNGLYPIIDEIPHMLPEDLREQSKDLQFLQRWKGKLQENILKEGRPFSLKSL